jgi:lysophospholipase L1-like esterase
MRKGLRAVLIAGTTTVLGLLAAEGYLRAFRPVDHLRQLGPEDLPPNSAVFHQRSQAPGLPYELVPGRKGTYAGVEVAINSLGQRGPEVTVAKPPGTYRVVALGDSLTFGYGAPQDGTWPAALERLLAQDRPALRASAVQVLNLGVSGYNSDNEARALEAKALPLDPDLIVVGYFLNDPQIAPMPAVQRWFHSPAWWERSHLLRYIDLLVTTRAKARYGGDPYRWLHEKDGDGWAMVLRAFQDMHRAASARGIPVLVATLPAYQPGPDWKDYRWADLHAQVIAAARANGLEAMDTVPEFQADGRQPKLLGADFEHPNAEGAEIIARAIAREVRRIAGARRGANRR